MGYKDYYAAQAVPNHFNLVGEKLQELEHMIRNRDTNASIKQQQKNLMMQALS